jgi:hypothetical protein
MIERCLARICRKYQIRCRLNDTVAHSADGDLDASAFATSRVDIIFDDESACIGVAGTAQLAKYC